MRFERGGNIKVQLSIGERGTIKGFFGQKDLMFQTHIYENMKTPSNWSYERRSWKKLPYYIVEVRNIEKDCHIAWAFCIKEAQEPASLFYVEKKKVIQFARERINRIQR